MTISLVAVVGADAHGASIAQHVASEGLPVLLLDRRREAAADAKTRVEMSLVADLERGLLKVPEVDVILARIESSGDLNAAAAADLIIEAFDESLGAKQRLLGELSAVCGPHVVFATSTGAFRVGQVAEGAQRPERVVGLHFMHHPAKNRLVELVAHAGSDPAAVRAAWVFLDRIRKTGIAAADSPGLIVGRLLGAWLNEAVRIHEEGVAAVDVDAAACQAFGVGAGPFALMNSIGIQTTAAVQVAHGETLGDLYQPVPLLLEQASRRRVWSVRGKADPGSARDIADRLWGVAIHVAGELLTEGAGATADIDIGARLGLGWTAGPVETINVLGLDRAARLAGAVEERFSLTLPRALAAQVEKGDGFAIESVRVAVDDGVATLTLNRPDQLNALDLDTLTQLGRRFADLAARVDVRAIIIAAAGPAFSRGADAGELADMLRSDRGAEPLLEYARRGQEILRTIETASVPVICRLDGPAIGSGAELLLACRAVVATPRASLSFPETCWGLQPMLGGIQRLTQRLGCGLARHLLLTGTALGAADLLATNLAWRVVAPDHVAAAIAEAVGNPPRRAPCELDRAPAELRDVGRFLGAVPVEGLLDGSLTLPGGGDILAVVHKIRNQAPQAVRTVAALTELAEEGDLEAGLVAENECLRALLETSDAVEGLTAAAENRSPEFRGV